MRTALSIVYKVVEITEVSDVDIEAALNEWTGQGWTFESMHFAMRESSKRPSMVFLTFTRGGEASDEPATR